MQNLDMFEQEKIDAIRLQELDKKFNSDELLTDPMIFHVSTVEVRRIN